VTPLYTWVADQVLGEGGPWKPYGDDPGPAVLVSENGDAFVAGAGLGGPPVPFDVVEEAPGRVVLSGRAANGVLVERTLEEVREGETCTLRSTVTWRNPTQGAIDGGTFVSMHDVVPESHSQYSSQRQPVVVVDEALVYGGPTGAGCVRAGTQLGPDAPLIPLEGSVTWFGLSDRYFGLYALPREGGESGTVTLTREIRGELALDGTVFRDARPLAPGESRSATFVLYGGPNQVDALAAVDDSLTKAVDLGWFAFFAWPLLWLLRWFHTLLGNWGLAIILLTVCVKALFFRMTQQSFRAMRRMQAIQPLLTEVRQKYADDPQEMNRRTMAVMAENKVNPLSGCLPQLVQIPVWLALYNALLTSVELYHTRFLYLKDLSEPDPYLVLPIAITFLMWAQQQLSTPTNLDPVQQQVMRWMPLIFGLLFFAFPSGLAVYVFVNVTLSIFQQWLINRSADPPPATTVPSPATGGATG
jgi:YidC/Oxa1 family membrane protein insertase